MEKCYGRGNCVGNVAQVNHVFEPGSSNPTTEDSRESDHSFEGEEPILFNEKCPHPQPEEIKLRGHYVSNLEIEGAIVRLEEVISTLRTKIGLDTSNPDKNDTILTHWLDPAPSAHPLPPLHV